MRCWRFLSAVLMSPSSLEHFHGLFSGSRSRRTSRGFVRLAAHGFLPCYRLGCLAPLVRRFAIALKTNHERALMGRDDTLNHGSRHQGEVEFGSSDVNIMGHRSHCAKIQMKKPKAAPALVQSTKK